MIFELAAGFVVGLLAGLAAMQVLWWTVRGLATTERPALLFTTSYALRMLVLLAVFGALGGWSVWALIASPVGFLDGTVRRDASRRSSNMRLTPDAQIFFEWGFIKLNATLLWSLVVDVALVVGAVMATRGLTPEIVTSRWQAFVEVVVELIQTQLAEITNDDPEPYLPFVGTLFLYIAVSNALVIFPVYEPPTGSLSTTSALAVCVLVAVPTFGIRRIGLGAYLKRYIEPSPLMLPFNIIGEISRTVALAIRLFGNIMSGSLMVAMIVALAPFFVPILINLLGLLTGLIQAYIFAVLAAVFIASGSRVQQTAPPVQSPRGEGT